MQNADETLFFAGEVTVFSVKWFIQNALLLKFGISQWKETNSLNLPEWFTVEN